MGLQDYHAYARVLAALGARGGVLEPAWVGRGTASTLQFSFFFGPLFFSKSQDVQVQGWKVVSSYTGNFENFFEKAIEL